MNLAAMLGKCSFYGLVMLPDGFIFIQRDWLSSNSLLLINNDQAVLFDTGYVTHAEMTFSVLDNFLLGRPLDLVLNTHLHSDHCGGNALLQSRFPDIEIGVPLTQFDDVTHWHGDKLSFEKTGQTCPPFKPSHGISAQCQLNLLNLPWETIQSPGHDNDSLMFYQPDFRILVSADALWEKGVSVVFPELDSINGFDPMFETFDLIERLNPSIVLPGHGPLFTDVESALAVSREKLSIFKADPKYHATYSAKVLIKFKLMELRQVLQTDFKRWCLQASLLLNIHQVFFQSISANDWVSSLLEDFHRKKSIDIQEGWIINL